MKMTVFWGCVPYSLVEIGDISQLLTASMIKVIIIPLIMEAISMSWHNIQKDSQPHSYSLP
jgi:hypothetical protein